MLNKLSQFLASVRPYMTLFVSIGYGLIVLFCLVGVLVGKGYLPVVGIVLACLCWVSARILQEATIALKILGIALKNRQAPQADEDHDS